MSGWTFLLAVPGVIYIGVEIAHMTPNERVGYIAMCAAAVAAVVYVLGCDVFPYARCRRCLGDGKSDSPFGASFRNCPRCKGTGRRERLGYKLFHRRRHIRREQRGRR